MIRNSRRLVCVVILWVDVLVVPASAGTMLQIADTTILRIGTGGVEGTYFPIGSLIAEAICVSEVSAAASVQPPRDRFTVADGPARSLLAVAQVSNGSVANIEDISSGLLEAALVQADIAYWAYHGDGLFAGKNRHQNLRAIATLYTESVHLVVAARLPVHSVADLKGLRVALDEPGSGTLVAAKIILDAFGLAVSDVQPVYSKPLLASELLQQNELDAFFMIAGYPVQAIQQLLGTNRAKLLTIDGPPVADLIERYPYFAVNAIPASVYQTEQASATLAVGAQLVADASLDEALIYTITRRLWDSTALQRYRHSHPVGKYINLVNALDNIAIPLHPGADRFYREQGLTPPLLATRSQRQLSAR